MQVTLSYINFSVRIIIIIKDIYIAQNCRVPLMRWILLTLYWHNIHPSHRQITITHTCSSSMTFTSSWLYDWGNWQRFCRISTSSPLGISSKWSSTKRFRKALERTYSTFIRIVKAIATTMPANNKLNTEMKIFIYSTALTRPSPEWEHQHRNMLPTCHCTITCYGAMYD